MTNTEIKKRAIELLENMLSEPCPYDGPFLDSENSEYMVSSEGDTIYVPTRYINANTNERLFITLKVGMEEM